jgi:hypothetical protein
MKKISICLLFSLFTLTVRATTNQIYIDQHGHVEQICVEQIKGCLFDLENIASFATVNDNDELVISRRKKEIVLGFVGNKILDPYEPVFDTKDGHYELDLSPEVEISSTFTVKKALSRIEFGMLLIPRLIQQKKKKAITTFKTSETVITVKSKAKHGAINDDSHTDLQSVK